MTKVALALSLVLLGTPNDDTAGWELAAKHEGMSIFSRKRADSNVHEMKAVGILDAAPLDVWSALRDYANYKSTMPYTTESKVLSVEEGGKVTYFYSVVDAPIVDKRDYVIKLLDESDWQDGKGFLLVTWATWDKGPPERKGFIRVKINDGFWKLEPREDGKKTYATYFVHTDPGGLIPTWVANKANSMAVPDVFKAIKKVIAKSKK